MRQDGIAELDPEVIEQAAEWMVRLDSDSADRHARQAWETWYQADPMHRHVFERMRGLDARMGALDPVSRKALAHVARKPRVRAKIALAALTLLSAGWLSQTMTLRQYMPQTATAHGEIRTMALADRSTLILDTETALDSIVNDTQRTITLFRGRVLANVTTDPTKPFTVRTADGSVTALGTAFQVRRENGVTEIAVTESRVRVCPGSQTSSACVVLAAGQQARIADGRVSAPEAVDARASIAWTRGWLEADDRPVAEVLAELARYHARPVHFDPAALHSVRVTGSYPLKDTNRALAALAATPGLRLKIAPEAVQALPGR